MFAVVQKFLQHVIPGVVRPLHILWNQVIGFLFIVLGAIALPSAIRSFNDPNGMPRFLLTFPFVVLMLGFGLSSFLRARKIGRP